MNWYNQHRVTRVIRTRSNGAISALFGLSSLEYRRIPASSAPKISRNFIRLSPIGFSDEQIVVPARQSPQVLLYVTARGLTKQERRDAVRKRGSDNSRYPNKKSYVFIKNVKKLLNMNRFYDILLPVGNGRSRERKEYEKSVCFCIDSVHGRVRAVFRLRDGYRKQTCV